MAERQFSKLKVEGSSPFYCSNFKINNMNIQNYFIGFKNIFLTTSRKCKSHESVNNVREGGYQGSR